MKTIQSFFEKKLNTDILSIIQCMGCIKNHLLDSGYVYLDIFVPNPLLLYRPVDVKAHVMNYHISSRIL